MPSLLQSSAVALHHCTEIGLNKVYFKNRWAKPRGSSSGGEGAAVHPSFALLQPACSALPGMCGHPSASPCSLLVPRRQQHRAGKQGTITCSHHSRPCPSLQAERQQPSCLSDLEQSLPSGNSQ